MFLHKYSRKEKSFLTTRIIRTKTKVTLNSRQTAKYINGSDYIFQRICVHLLSSPKNEGGQQFESWIASEELVNIQIVSGHDAPAVSSFSSTPLKCSANLHLISLGIQWDAAVERLCYHYSGRCFCITT